MVWFQILGFAVIDIGYNANQIHPDWFDVLRSSKPGQPHINFV